MEWIEVWDKVVEVTNAAMEGVNKALLAIFGNSNERAVRKLRLKVEQINALEEQIQKLSNEELADQTRKFRERLAAGETLDSLLVEAFATCREAGKRYLGMRHYDSQLLGGMVLHSGRIAEMVTGEGKTLVATLPAYLNALAGKGVHVVTVNDYLARRDAEWMSPLFSGLGMKVGAIQSNMDPHDRRHHYHCDITYGTNNEFGFDYLRDNMKPTKDQQAQGDLHYAIIDEVDSILIDEARTPLIIAGPAIDDPTKYSLANRIAAQLKRDDHFEVKEKEHTCHLTDQGVLEAERLVGVESFYTAGNMEWPHLIDNALKALHLYRRDKEYMVRDGEVIIIDEHTGRAMEGRQWSDGLHQAVEAKEGVKIKEETQTLATITFQNFFKLYSKISGMTGTAMTEASEFYKIYKLDVVAIPTNKPLSRVNHPDVIYCTQKEKWKAVIDEIKSVHKTGRPILVGTTSVEKSEYLSEMCKRSGIKHEVLNAKFIEREAEIVAQAGRLGMVTIATNMAGRGTDIILGGNAENMAWSQLKERYNTRLDVPAEEWRLAMAPFADEMKTEGRKIANPRPTIELARDVLKLKDPEKMVEVVEKARPRQMEDPAKLARENGIDDVEGLANLIDLYHLARPGGIHIIGTERHESRRIDNQLRGRAGRQGDPGSSRFFLSLEDDLMRIFAGDFVRNMLQRLGMQEGDAIESRMVSRRIEGAQRKVEERNFDIRKNLLEYDEIMDNQRKRIYGFRQQILEGANCKELVLEMIDHQVEKAVENFLAKGYGATSFAAWASMQLRIEFKPSDFARCEFDTADTVAKEEAQRQTETLVMEVIDENLNEDVDEREWNWDAVANWANTRWGLKLKGYDLKRMGRDGLDQHLYDLGSKVIEQTSLEMGKECFDDDFGFRNLVGWTNQKFAMNLTVEELPTQDPEEKQTVIDFLERKVEEAYAGREIAFPVHCGMARFMADKATHGTETRYDREGLVAWASERFRTPFDIEEFRTLSRSEVVARLMEASKSFFRDGVYHDEIDDQLDTYFPKKAEEASAESLQPLSTWASQKFGTPLTLDKPLLSRDEVQMQLLAAAERVFRPEIREMERSLLLQFLDTGWKDHLYAMDHLRSGIGLIGYAQVDPKVEYKRRGRQIFLEMWSNFEDRVTDMIFRAEEADTRFITSIWNVTNASHVRPAQNVYTTDEGQTDIQRQQEAAIEASQGDAKAETIRNKSQRVGRNDPCPCGSGKKYKNCCMKKKIESVRVRD